MRKAIFLVVMLSLAGCASAGGGGSGIMWFARDGMSRESFEQDVNTATARALSKEGVITSILSSGRRYRVATELEEMGYRLVPKDQAEPWACYPSGK